MNLVHMVTVLKLALDDDRKIVRSRTWGYAESHEEAEAWVLSNATDMFEMNYYNHAVIEAVPPGLIASAKSERWYFADYGDRDTPLVFGDGRPHVRAIDKPACLSHTVSFWGG